MDWKYKHFHQERIFAAPQDTVRVSARKQFVESLGWQISETAEGFNAVGSSFAHQCKATLRFQPDGVATQVIIDLTVSRAGGRGFMLFDVGGYYNIQIRHWLDGMQWNLHTQLSPETSTSPQPPAPSANKGGACVFNGCIGFIVAMFLLYVLVTFFEAIVGLITGHLYLLGRGGTIVVEGNWGRVASALILTLLLYLAWRFKRKSSSKI